MVFTESMHPKLEDFGTRGGTALTFVYSAAVKERRWTGSKGNWDLVLVTSDSY